MESISEEDEKRNAAVIGTAQELREIAKLAHNKGRGKAAKVISQEEVKMTGKLKYPENNSNSY